MFDEYFFVFMYAITFVIGMNMLLIIIASSLGSVCGVIAILIGVAIITAFSIKKSQGGSLTAGPYTGGGGGGGGFEGVRTNPPFFGQVACT